MTSRYTPMQIQRHLCESSFNAAMGEINVPIYLHVHPLLLDVAKEILAARNMTPNKHIVGEPRYVEALADDSITNVNEWWLETSIGSNAP